MRGRAADFLSATPRSSTVGPFGLLGLCIATPLRELAVVGLGLLGAFAGLASAGLAASGLASAAGLAASGLGLLDTPPDFALPKLVTGLA